MLNKVQLGVQIRLTNGQKPDSANPQPSPRLTSPASTSQPNFARRLARFSIARRPADQRSSSPAPGMKLSV